MGSRTIASTKPGRHSSRRVAPVFAALGALVVASACGSSGTGSSGPSGPSGSTSGGGSGATSGAGGAGGSSTATSSSTSGAGGGLGALCDHAPPKFTSMPVTQIAAGALYSYQAHADPGGTDPVLYVVHAKPPISVGPRTGLVRWVPNAADQGDVDVELVATDAKGCRATQDFKIHVGAENHPPEITSTAPAFVLAGQAYAYKVGAVDADGDALTYSLVTAPQGMQVAPDGTIGWTPQAGDVGVQKVQVKVADPSGASATQTWDLAVGSGQGGPLSVAITTPSALDEVTGFAPVHGTAAGASLLVYYLDVCDADALHCEPVFTGKQSVQNGLLGQADTGGLPNGLAVLRVRAYDQAGNMASDQRKVRVAGGLKLGGVELSFLDEDIAAQGMQLRVVRSYSSLRRRVSGSFGYGWQLDLSDGYSLERSRPDGDGWDGQVDGFLNVTVNEIGDPHYFVFKTPSQQQYVFGFSPDMQYGGIGLLDVTPNYVDVFDTGATMQPTFPPGQLIFTPGGGQITDDSFNLYQPDDFTIQTAEGVNYQINRLSGLKSIQDPNGNSISIGPNGVTHSNGRSLAIQRDGAGRVTKVTDPVGNSIDYKYDAAGNLVEVDKPEGVVEKYTYGASHLVRDVIGADAALLSRKEYDERGRVVKETSGDGHVRTYAYDDANHRETVDDGGGEVHTVEYGPRGELVGYTTPSGAKYSATYDAQGHLLSQTAPTGETVSYQYDARGRVIEEDAPHAPGEPAIAYATKTTYDAKNAIVSQTVPGGARLDYSYDQRGNLLEVRDESGALLDAEAVDGAGELTSSADPMGGATTYAVDAKGDRTSGTDELGQTTSATYDAAGNITSMKAPDGTVADFALDGFGRPKTVAVQGGAQMNRAFATNGEWRELELMGTGKLTRSFDLNGQVKSYDDGNGDHREMLYDEQGRLVGQTDGFGRVTSFTYDADGRPVVANAPDGATTKVARDAAGRVTKQTFPDGANVQYAYLPTGELASVTDPLGHVSTMTYDAQSVTATDPLLHATTTYFNAHGLKTKVAFADGTSRSFTYLGTNIAQGADEYPTSATDELGRKRSFGYDAKGRRTSSTSWGGESYTLAWAGKELVSITSPTGEAVTYDYDALGRRVAVHEPDGATTKLEYGPSSEIAKTTLPDGATIQNAYDVYGQLLSYQTSDGLQASFAYDVGHRMTQAKDGAGTTTFTYDAGDRPTRIDLPDGATLYYGYDAMGRVTGVEVQVSKNAPLQKTFYGYDAAGRLASVKDPLGGTTTFDYDKGGNLARRTLPNGVQTTYQYDARDRLIGVHHQKNGAVVASVDVERAASGEPTKVVYDDAEVHYQHDGSLRLAGEQHSGVASLSATYAYDAGGKRTSKMTAQGTTSYAYGKGYRLDATSGGGDDEQLAYDPAGRVTSLARDGATTTIGYDALDRVRSVSAQGGAVKYAYDHEGNRTRADDPGGAVRRFVVAPLKSGARPYAIADGKGQAVMTYVYAGARPLLRIDAQGKPVYYLEDELGSTVALADAQGARVASFHYDAFGRVLASSGAEKDAPAAAGGEFLYQGAWREAQTGLYHFHARDYDARTGRFLTEDPAPVDELEPESLNRWAFEANDPLVYADPTGEFEVISLTVGMNFQSMMSNIKTAAVQAVKQEIKSRVQEFFVQLLLNQVFPGLFSSLGGFGKVMADLIANPPANGNHGNVFANYIIKKACRIFHHSLDFAFFAVLIQANGNVLFDGLSCNKYSDAGVDKIKDLLKPKNGGLTPNEADYALGPLPPSKGGLWLVGDFKAKASTIDVGKPQVLAIARLASAKAMHIVGYVVWKLDRSKRWLDTVLEAKYLANGLFVDPVLFGFTR